MTNGAMTAAIVLQADIICYAVCTVPVIAFSARTDKLQSTACTSILADIRAAKYYRALF